MRESSYNLSKQNFQKTKDIRGGEQKVMKKSLSTILSLAMAFSMFSSVALAAETDATKTSADFTDLKDLDAATKVKFDALISAGVFDGVKEGTFGLKDEMNRAQFAKVAALIFNLKVDTTAKTSTFSDVKSDDPANGYALPYIEAVKAAGITDGYAPGQFNPAGKVTKEQLATFLVRGLGQDSVAKATPGVTDTTVTDWAKGYVALALQLKLLSNGTDGKFGGTSNATRDLLVLGASEAKSQYKGPKFDGRYAISSLKATDANKLTLQLNGALTAADATNLKVELKNANGAVVTNYTTAWSEDKTTATLTFETKFQEGTYTATISGLTNIDTTASTASVTVTPERITKIEFLTASETLPRTTNKLRIEFKATNQYGAQSSLSANNFNINTSSDISVQNITGQQAFYVQQAVATNISGTPTTNDSKLQRNDRVSITVVHQDSGVTANKVFAIGDNPYVAKIEAGELLNSANTAITSLEYNTNVYLGFKALDQYGINVETAEELNKGVTVYATDGNIVDSTSTGNETSTNEFFVSNEIGDDAADLKLKYNRNESKDNVTLTLIANGTGQQITKTLKVTTSKVPATVEFGSYTYTLAAEDDSSIPAIANDSDLRKKFYIPLIVKDSKGDTLSADDIAKNAYKFNIYSNGGITLDNSFNVAEIGTTGTRSTPIVQTGEYKGMIKVSRVSSKGNAGITVMLNDNPNVKSNLNVSVGDVRKADKISYSSAAKKFMVGNTDNEFKLKVYDQYGGELKLSSQNGVQTKVLLALNGTPSNGFQLRSNDVVQDSAGNPTATTTKKYVIDPSTTASSVTSNVYNGTALTGTVVEIPTNDIFDKAFKFYTGNVTTESSFTLTAYLLQADSSNANGWRYVSNAPVTIGVLNAESSSTNLNYEVYLDKGVNNTILAVDDYLGGVNGATYVRDNFPKFGKELKVRATTSGGDVVAVPTNISSVSSSNPATVGVFNTKFITGLDAGTASINVVYNTAKLNDKATSTLTVTTKNEAPAVSSIVAAKSGNTLTRTTAASKITAGTLYAWDEQLFEKLTIKDQYGDEIVSDRSPGSLKKDNGTAPADQFVQIYAASLGLTFYISDIVGTGTVAIDNTGKITAIDAGVTGFTVNLLATNGKTVSTVITVN
ncbi:S-layer homology domain-containing protein [Paenibacillus agricola]|uniref:S-layer homology domain-containing protein n=1 Tax=Paenibacillus agricola TaxID=2716264 RepID=A0ABX0JG30_9BACL|nr:S-layer homology domain-containing protein [Paenibacillus agricola]NHN33852.1 S-layer homology domain-containing protein [Paenibacillus agricola]